MARPQLAVLAATLIGGMSLFSPPMTRAAEIGMQVVTQAHYTALPAEKRVHVVVDAVARNVKPDPPNGRYYYTETRFGVQPAIRNLEASSGSRTLAASVVSSSQQFTAVDVAFGRSIFHGESISFRLSFDIVDPGGAPQRDVRVANSLVAFPVWAFGSGQTPGSSVSVAVPAQYAVTVVAGQLTTTHGANGTTVLSATQISDPPSFFAYLTAERPGAFVDSTATVPLSDGPVTVKVRAWDDDPDWGRSEQKLVTEGLPQLRSLIGLPYLVRGQLVVEEAAVSRLGDYAGVYDSVTEVIRVRYDADDFTTLHEAAHTWFNANLFSGRWIGEAWAEYYAVEAGKRIGADGQIFAMTPQLTAAKIPLNAWGAIGDEPQLTEDYAYAATYHLAQLIAARAKIDGLQRVWQAAEGGIGSYQPAHAPATPEQGTAATADGWQRLLDLLEERTGVSYADLWTEWVVTPDQRPELSARATARTDYQRTLAVAGAWDLPYTIRYDMGAWQFDDAGTILAQARAVLGDRDRIAAQAKRLGLAVPGTLKHDFETATGLEVSAATARGELDALGAIATATSVLGAPQTPVEWVGLLWANPSSHLGASRGAFARGEIPAARSEAEAASLERRHAADVGRLRVAVAGGSLLVVDGLAMAGLALRRRRPRAAAKAHPIDDASTFA
jgi:hypothetical protein